jgi:enamine deaminase RidA (YjgF/YER057c/UK114 family)
VKYGLAILLALVALMAGTVAAQTQQATASLTSAEKNTEAKPNTAIRRMNPPTLSKPNGYTHVVVATGSRMIYIAGQTAVDRDGNLVGPGDFRAQAKQAFENLKAGLAAAGVGFDQVVKLNYYVLDMANAPVLREVRTSYLGSAFPASTLVEVKKLARDEFMLEIEAIAVSAK